MAEYLAPGVYVEEMDTGPKPIEGVSTSTAGFVGATVMGPAEGLPRLITSFTEFQRLYGGFLPEDPWHETRFLAYAVKGFFENGGQRVYIQRVVGNGADASTRELSNGIEDGTSNYLLTRLAEDMVRDDPHIMLVSSRGVQAGVTGVSLRFVERDGAAIHDESIAVTSVDGDRVTLASFPTGNFPYTRAAVVLIPTAITPAPTLRLQAANPGAWGDRLRVRVTPSTRTSTRLVGIDLSARLVRQQIDLSLGAAIDDTTPRNVITLGAGQAATLRVDDFLRFDSASGAPEDTTIAAVDSTANTVTVDPALAQNYAADTTTTVTLVTPVALRVNDATNTVTVNIETTPGFRNGDRIAIEDDDGVLRGEITAVTLDSQLTIRLTGNFPADRDLPVGITLRLLNAGRNADWIRVAGARNLQVGDAVELQNGLSQRIYATVLAIDGSRVQLSQNVDPTYLEGDPLRTCEFDLQVQFVQRNLRTGREEVVREETHRLLNMVSGSRNNAVTRINEDSNMLQAEDLSNSSPPPFNFPTTIDFATSSSLLYLQNGQDGDRPLPRHYRGVDGGPGARTGIAALEDIDVISVIAAPGQTDTSVQNALIEQCERLMDRFAVLDGPAAADLEEIQEFRNDYDTRYAALYHPWLVIRDPLDDAERLVSPSGHVVGIYARTDVERGVHKAPANEVVRGIVDVEQIINKREQDILNPANINVIRDFRERRRGIRVWGARCVTSDADWKYVNVRRLFIYLEESLEEGTQWVVFEPNDEPLWARVRQSVTNFLTRVWRDGALMGRTPEEAFFVRCDRTTMTQDDIDNGRLIMLIGVAPVKPAEFVIIRIGQWSGGSEVTEP